MALAMVLLMVRSLDFVMVILTVIVKVPGMALVMVYLMVLERELVTAL